MFDWIPKDAREGAPPTDLCVSLCARDSHAHPSSTLTDTLNVAAHDRGLYVYCRNHEHDLWVDDLRQCRGQQGAVARSWPSHVFGMHVICPFHMRLTLPQAILMSSQGDVTECSVDHRFEESAVEQQRVLATGAVLAQATSARGNSPAGPLRAWPGGLAMGRALGDADCGEWLICDPQPQSFQMLPPPATHCSVVICSDGCAQPRLCVLAVWWAIVHHLLTLPPPPASPLATAPCSQTPKHFRRPIRQHARMLAVT